MTKSKVLWFVFLVALITIWTSGSQHALLTGPASLQAASSPENGVIVYQFHRRFRCDACYKLEQAINEGLKIHFPAELKNGSLVYRVMDLDEEDTDQYEKKYDFFYNTVIVVDVEGGIETRFKNLESVWGMVEEKEAVIEFIKNEVEDYL